MIKRNYSIIIFILFLYYIHSQKIIQINAFDSVYCNKDQSKTNPQFSFRLNVTFINISSMKYFELPLKGPNNLKAVCTPHPSFSDITCNMNVEMHPIIDEKVFFETSFVEINGVKIIWNLKSSEIFEGTCTYNYNYVFTVGSYEENPTCVDEYNVFIMNGIEGIKKIMNNAVSSATQISFLIEIDDQSGSTICYWYSSENYMQCKVKTEKAKAKGKFYRTIFTIPYSSTSVLINQSFEINFKDCRPEIYFNITNSSAICDKYDLEIYLFTNYKNYKDISYNYFPLINPKNQYLSCRSDYRDTKIKCEIDVRRYPIINEKYTFDTSFTRIEDDKINILWNLDNPTVFEGTCTPEYSKKFTVTKYDEDIKCNNGYNYFNFYGTYEDYNLKNNKFLSYLLSETIKVQFFINLNNELKYIDCYIYDTEGRMECWLNALGNITFFTTTASNTADNSLILISQSYQTELKNCKTEEKIMEITKISSPECNKYDYTEDYSVSFYLLINIQNIDYKTVNDFELPLKIKNYIFKAICSLLYIDNMICKLNITAFPIINEEIYLDTSIRMINDDIKLIWSIGNPSLLVYKGTCIRDYNYKFTVNKFDKETTCENNYTNSINIYGTYENKEKNNNNLKEYNINMNIFINEELKNIKCTLDNNKGKMKCFIEEDQQKKAKFFNTMTNLNYGSDLLLIEQEFEIEVKNCSLYSYSSNYKLGFLSLLSLLSLIL